MTVDRSLYASSFEDLPDWPCPTCGKGHLKTAKASMLIEETGSSIAARDHGAWDPDWVQRRFAGILTCDFTNCGELVAVLGNVNVEERYEHIGDGHWDRVYGDLFHPRSLLPAPLPIRPPSDTPELVSGALQEAAALLWQSPEGAANQVRQAVEHLMDCKGVTRSLPGAYLSLHSRISEFRVQDAKNAEILLAVKWLGNNGSHAGGLTRDDVFDAFDMLELVLVNLYDTTTADIMTKVKAINTQRGPVRPTP